MNKIIVYIFLITGIIIMAAAFLNYAGNALPYQDATPELLAHQAAIARKWSIIFVLGLITTTVASIWLWKGRISKRNI